MQISFSGTLSPYSYNCPHAHRLKNIEQVVIEKNIDEDSTKKEDKLSSVMFGIQQHECLAQYLKGEIESYEYTTSTIEWFKAQSDIKVEKTNYYMLDFSSLPSKPASGAYIVARPDIVVYSQDGLRIADWKFGTFEYGSPRYYDEIGFYMALESASNFDVNYWETLIHFPVQNYTLPLRTYNVYQIAYLQQSYIQRIEVIMNDKFYVPNPGKIRCRFCNYRSKEAGGAGYCTFTVI